MSVLIVWSLALPSTRRPAWANKNATVALLRSPYTGAALHVAIEGGREILVSPSGERFPIRQGITEVVGMSRLLFDRL